MENGENRYGRKSGKQGSIGGSLGRGGGGKKLGPAERLQVKMVDSLGGWDLKTVRPIRKERWRAGDTREMRV